MTTNIKAYWWNNHGNLGDALTPLLLQHFGFNPERVEAANAEVCVIGSILELVGPEYSGAIIGAGFISEGGAMAMPRARLLAVRGPLSAARIGMPNALLGDAGLLCPMLLPEVPRAHIRIGIVPHFKDKGNAAIAEIVDRCAGQIRIIDVQDDPIRVIGEIAQCEAVLSSSLHGLIVAEAFRRRTAWLVLSDAVIGAGYKFRDHYGACGLEAQPHTLTGCETLEQLEAMTTLKTIDLNKFQTDLISCFRKL